MMADGPMHYIASTKFAASDRDCWGKRKGEANRWENEVRFNGVPVTHRIGNKFAGWLKTKVPQVGFSITSFVHDRDPKTFTPNWTLTFAGETFGSKWHECPFNDETAAREFCEDLNNCGVEVITVETGWSEGKERELDAARRAACWPEATDEDLVADGLEERLLARLPALMERFKGVVEGLGMEY